jgi:UDP-N-acetylmuramoylalanine--D-glutamate ligase
LKRRIFDAKNIKKAILIGEIKEQLTEGEDPEKFEYAETLEEAVEKAKTLAEKVAEDTSSNYDLCLPVTKPLHPVVLMSPGAASFDMFKNFEDRGTKYQNIVNNLK